MKQTLIGLTAIAVLCLTGCSSKTTEEIIIEAAEARASEFCNGDATFEQYVHLAELLLKDLQDYKELHEQELATDTYKAHINKSCPGKIPAGM